MPAGDDAPGRRTPLRLSYEERVTKPWYRRAGGRKILAPERAQLRRAKPRR